MTKLGFFQKYNFEFWSYMKELINVIHHIKEREKSYIISIVAEKTLGKT